MLCLGIDELLVRYELSYVILNDRLIFKLSYNRLLIHAVPDVFDIVIVKMLSNLFHGVIRHGFLILSLVVGSKIIKS